MQEEIEILKKRAVRGSFILLLRKFFLRSLTFIGSVFLARLLEPQIFGIFAIVNFVVSFFQAFSDVGLGAALIQKEKIKTRDLRTTFTFQQILVTLMVLIIFFTSPLIVSYYNLSSSGVWFLRALSLSLFFTSLKTIPTILLERRLKFNKLVIPEIIEVISFQVLAVGLAYSGFGVWSFIIAMVVRTFLGTVVLNLLCPWPIGLDFDKKIIQELLSFGIPYQLNYFLALIKDSVTPLLVGAVSGSAAVGFLNWAFSFSKLPLEFLSDIFRVTFPGFSRIQQHKELVRKAVGKSLYFSNLILFGVLAVLAGLVEPIIHFVYTNKWLPALPAFYIHSLGLVVFGINSTLINLFWSLRRVKNVLKIMIVSTILNWGLSVPLLFKTGFNGVMWASTAVLLMTCFLSIYLVRRFLKVEIVKNTKVPLISGLLTFLTLFLLIKPWVKGFPTLISGLLIGGLLYLCFILLLGRKRFQDELRWVFSKIKA